MGNSKLCPTAIFHSSFFVFLPRRQFLHLLSSLLCSLLSSASSSQLFPSLVSLHSTRRASRRSTSCHRESIAPEPFWIRLLFLPLFLLFFRLLSNFPKTTAAFSADLLCREIAACTSLPRIPSQEEPPLSTAAALLNESIEFRCPGWKKQQAVPKRFGQGTCEGSLVHGMPVPSCVLRRRRQIGKELPPSVSSPKLTRQAAPAECGSGFRSSVNKSAPPPTIVDPNSKEKLEIGLWDVSQFAICAFNPYQPLIDCPDSLDTKFRGKSIGEEGRGCLGVWEEKYFVNMMKSS